MASLDQDTLASDAPEGYTWEGSPAHPGKPADTGSPGLYRMVAFVGTPPPRYLRVILYQSSSVNPRHAGAATVSPYGMRCLNPSASPRMSGRCQCTSQESSGRWIAGKRLPRLSTGRRLFGLSWH